MAMIQLGQITITKQDGQEVIRKIETLSIDVTEMEKQGHAHFMLKELSEAPAIMGESFFNNTLSYFDQWKNIHRLIFVGCGGGYYASLYGAFLAEKYLSLSSQAVSGSEFRYQDFVLDAQTLVVLVSQSGETADTLAALRKAKQASAQTVAFVNVMESAIARETDRVIPLGVGPEIAVASTKAMHGMIRSLISFVHEWSLWKGGEGIPNFFKEHARLSNNMKCVLAQQDKIKQLAQKYLEIKHFLILGRGGEFSAAKEGALKFMEIAYTPAQAFSSGELKHGPLALIDEQALSLFLIPKDGLYEKNLISIQEVQARGGHMIALTTEGNHELDNLVDEVIFLPKTTEVFHPILSIFVLQFFAYYLAVFKGFPVDQPRNLAKSVTVE
ncbi:MAG: Isomerizing Glutamine-fructose-6-phosphate aminotransferase [Candidatus Uhrbacteria bacterium GW2011_GWE2_40_58]|nr:MAG: Isomerizing Glutamine-fructose-6-phosphate aminotransferase [Candidatus Uhrbacteria bacterium GW2011_GWE2_40_58]